jgi:TonB family protein
MRRILAASVLLSPLLFTASAVASQPIDDSSASTAIRPVSTGVTSPKIVRSTDIVLTPEIAGTIPAEAEVVLKLNVDEQGNPEDIQILKSDSALLGERVMDAVREFRWRPATLDNQPIPVGLTLNVLVQH